MGTESYTRDGHGGPESAPSPADLLAEAGARLATTLDYRATLHAVADLVVPRLADFCFVEMLRPDGTIAREVMRAADPGRQALAHAYDRRWPLDPGAAEGSPRVIRTGEPELIEELPAGYLEPMAADPEQRALLTSIGFRSALIVPLRVRGEVIGDLALATAESGRRFGAQDLVTAQELADRCASHIDNARLVTDLRAAEAELRGSRDELEAILEGVADAITVQEPDGRLVYVNQAAVDLLGYPDAAALLAAPITEVVARFEMLAPDDSPLDLEAMPGRRVLRGEQAEPLIVRYRRKPDGRDRWARIKARPVHGAGGEVRLAINVIEDITDLKRAEETQRFLADASQILAGSLDYGDTLRQIARLAVPRLADWCAVDLLDDQGAVEQVAIAHADPSRMAQAEELRRRYPVGPQGSSGVAEILRTGRAMLVEEIGDAQLREAAQDADHLRLLRALNPISAIAVPMLLRGRALGVITLVNADSDRRFDAHDLPLAEDLAARAGTAVDNARLYRTRSAIAQTLQASLLPPHLPEIEGVESAARYRAAGEGSEVGGDFYDLFSVADGHWIAVIGDVCGKGAAAAAVTALARYTIRTAAVRRRSPAAILRWVSDAMVRHDPQDGRFCTIACVHLETDRTPVRITVACGGHPLPLILRADGSVAEAGGSGTLLGLVEDPDVQDHEAQLQPGDTLVLYTDGLTEAHAPQHVWSADDLASALRGAAGDGPAGVLDHLEAAALGPDGAARDDVALLALRPVV